MEEGGDNRYRESHIYAMDLASGDIRQLTRDKGPWASPAVSPDGRRIAYTGYPWTPQTYKTTDLYVMELDGSGSRLVSGGPRPGRGKPALGRGLGWGLLHRR